MLNSGLAYTFSIYSENMKERFNYTQTEIAGVGTACNIGGYLAIFAGLFYDSLRQWNRSALLIPSKRFYCRHYDLQLVMGLKCDDGKAKAFLLHAATNSCLVALIHT